MPGLWRVHEDCPLQHGSFQVLLPPLDLPEHWKAVHARHGLLCAAEHPWLSGKEVSDAPLGNEMLRRLKNFCSANKMKKLALKASTAGALSFHLIGFLPLARHSSGT